MTAAFPRLALLGDFERSPHDYCVLTPPDSIETAPVLDVLIEPRGRDGLAALLSDRGFRPAGRTADAAVFTGETAEGPLVLALRHEFAHRGMPFAKAAWVMSRRQPQEKAAVPVPGPSPEDRLFVSVLAWCRGSGGGLAPDVRDLARRRDLDDLYLSAHAKETGLEAVFAEARALAAANAESVPRALAKRMTRALVARSGENASLLIRHSFSRRPRRGAVIALVGPDGCGKSSTGRATEAILRAVPGLSTRIAYLGPWGQIRLPSTRLCYRLGLVPEAIPWTRRLRARLAGKPETEDSLLRCAVKAGKAQVRGLVYYAAISLELHWRYFRDVRPTRRRGGVVLAERYVYDLAFVHDSVAIEAYPVLRKLVCRLFPRPDLTILLDNDPEEIHRRKPQLAVAEIAHQRAAYRRVLAPLPHRIVRTEKGLAAVATEVAIAALGVESGRSPAD